jgi:hypothetical protein
VVIRNPDSISVFFHHSGLGLGLQSKTWSLTIIIAAQNFVPTVLGEIPPASHRLCIFGERPADIRVKPQNMLEAMVTIYREGGDTDSPLAGA